MIKHCLLVPRGDIISWFIIIGIVSIIDNLLLSGSIEYMRLVVVVTVLKRLIIRWVDEMNIW